MYATVQTHVLLKSVHFTVYKLYRKKKKKVTTSNFVQVELVIQHSKYLASLWSTELLFIWNLPVCF